MAKKAAKNVEPSGVLTPKDIFLTLARNYFTAVSMQLAQANGRYGANRLLSCLDSITNALDFHARSGDPKDDEIKCSAVALIYVKFLAEGNNEYAERLADNLQHSLGHIRGALSLIGAGKFTPDMLDCVKQTTDELNGDFEDAEVADFVKEREEWYRKESYYRKHPDRRPESAPEGLDFLKGLFQMMNPHHRRAKPAKSGIIEL